MAPATTTSPAPIPFGIPYKTNGSAKNTQAVLQEVQRRFPQWAAQCQPYVNVLTLKGWNRRGFRVRRGEHAIRVATLIPVTRQDDKTGEKIQAGTRPGTACVFAFPQVEKRA